MTLTPKQERFAQEVASGKTQSDAYRIAFNVRPTTKPESVNVSACKLMANANVTQRVEELRAAATEQLVWTIHDSLEVLSAIAKGLDEDAKPSDKVNAVKALNSMYGLDEPSKLNLNGSIKAEIAVHFVKPTSAPE
jgi:phage terminase small subunit